MLAVAAVALASASVTYLSSTGALRLGGFPATASQARTQPLADSGLRGGGRVEVSPPPPSWPTAPRTGGLIPPGAIGVLLKQFGGLNDQPPLGLKAWVHINDSYVIGELAHLLNALPPFPGGIFSCPFDDGSYFVLDFTYADASSTALKVEARGCGGVFVGGWTKAVAWTATSPGLINYLIGLVAKPAG